ncbi:unnamed protein product [Parajaminaea phylloscopi]
MADTTAEDQSLGGADERSREDIQRLLDLPALQATLFRGVALTRPVGPCQHWAIVAIAEEINAAIRELQDRRGMRLNAKQRRERKRKRSHTQSTNRGERAQPLDQPDRDSADRSKELSPLPDDKSIGQHHASMTGNRRGEGSDAEGDEEDDDEEDEDTEDEDEDEDYREQEEVGRLSGPTGTLEVTPRSIYAKLGEYFDLKGLDKLENANLRPEELAPSETVRNTGYGSSDHRGVPMDHIDANEGTSAGSPTTRGKPTPDGFKDGKTEASDGEGVPEGEGSEKSSNNGDSGSEQAIEFVLVPPLDYTAIIEELAQETGPGKPEDDTEDEQDAQSSPLSETTSPVKPSATRRRSARAAVAPPAKRVKRENRESADIDGGEAGNTSSELSEEAAEDQRFDQEDGGLTEKSDEDEGDTYEEERTRDRAGNRRVVEAGSEDGSGEGEESMEGDDEPDDEVEPEGEGVQDGVEEEEDEDAEEQSGLEDDGDRAVDDDEEEPEESEGADEASADEKDQDTEDEDDAGKDEDASSPVGRPRASRRSSTATGSRISRKGASATAPRGGSRAKNTRSARVGGETSKGGKGATKESETAKKSTTTPRRTTRTKVR